MKKILSMISILFFMLVGLAFAQEGETSIKDVIGLYEMIVGIFLPLIISVFVREQWTKERKLWISLGFVILASAGYVFYSGEFDLVNIGGTVLKIFGISVTTYKLFWLPSGVTNGLEMGSGLTNK